MLTGSQAKFTSLSKHKPLRIVKLLKGWKASGTWQAQWPVPHQNRETRHRKYSRLLTQSTTVLNDQLQNTVAPPSVPSWDEMSAFIETEAEKVANGSSAEDAATAIEAKAESLGTGW